MSRDPRKIVSCECTSRCRRCRSCVTIGVSSKLSDSSNLQAADQHEREHSSDDGERATDLSFTCSFSPSASSCNPLAFFTLTSQNGRSASEPYHRLPSDLNVDRRASSCAGVGETESVLLRRMSV